MSVSITKKSNNLVAQKFFTSFKFDANCSAVFRIKETSSNTPVVNIRNLNPKYISVVENLSNDELSVEVVANYEAKQKTQKEIEVENDVIDSFKEAFSQGSIKGFFSTLTKNALKIHAKHGNINSNMEVVIDIELPVNFKLLDIRATDLDCNINHSSIKNINIRADNTDLCSQQDIGAENFTANILNGDIEFVAGSRTKNAYIDGNNCDVKIHKKGYKGNIKATGNNISVSGNARGDANFGEIRCRLDNGDVNIF